MTPEEQAERDRRAKADAEFERLQAERTQEARECAAEARARRQPGDIGYGPS